MKLQILSDLHLECQAFTPVKSDADVVVLAGDIHTKGRGLEWAEATFKQPVLWVLGNHDYWGGHLENILEKVKAQAAVRGQVHVLENEAVVLEGVRFFGATLWTDYDLDDNRPNAMQQAQERMRDFRKVRYSPGSYRKLTPSAVALRHAQTRFALQQWLNSAFEGKTVVISHHAPSARSLTSYDRGHPLDASYASDLEAFMGPEVDLWVHGHVHQTLDYDVKGTRVVCNPRGYLPAEPNPGFNESFFVDL